MTTLTLKDGYSRLKNPPTKTFRPMTPAEALTVRGSIYFTGPQHTEFRQCRTNGAPKTWKTRDDVELPVKYGLKECARAYSAGPRDTGEMRLPSGGILLVEVPYECNCSDEHYCDKCQERERMGA